jgi:hypothetical protein
LQSVNSKACGSKASAKGRIILLFILAKPKDDY